MKKWVVLVAAIAGVITFALWPRRSVVVKPNSDKLQVLKADVFQGTNWDYRPIQRQVEQTVEQVKLRRFKLLRMTRQLNSEAMGVCGSGYHIGLTLGITVPLVNKGYRMGSYVLVAEDKEVINSDATRTPYWDSWLPHGDTINVFTAVSFPYKSGTYALYARGIGCESNYLHVAQVVVR